MSLGLFDLFWGLEGPDDAGTRPKPEHRTAVLEVGGTIVHQFHLPMIRAILAPSSVSELGTNMATGVPDATAFTLDVAVGYSRSVTDDDIALFESLGGVVTHQFINFDAITGVLPDSAIPILRARPEVRFVEGNGVSCLAGG